MPKKVIDKKTGKLKRAEYSLREMAEDVLDTDQDRLLSWKKTIPPSKGSGEKSFYYFENSDQLSLIKKRAALLKTGMSEAAVLNVEKTGLLDAYAKLSRDCPEGLTAHVWRSYGFIVLMQVRKNVKINPEQLAQGANINKRDKNGKIVPSPEMAAKHIRLLQAFGYLTDDGERWEHQGLPEFWQSQ